MANQVEGLNGTRSTYEYENIEIVEIDGVRMIRRLKDKKIIGLNAPKKEPQERKNLKRDTINDNSTRANQGIKI